MYTIDATVFRDKSKALFGRNHVPPPPSTHHRKHDYNILLTKNI